MKSTAFASAASIAAILALSACSPPPSTVRDTGNMAYPAPLPQGNVARTVTGGRSTGPTDTGNMAYPAPLPQGNVSTTVTGGRSTGPTDTGNMAYPAPLPQGNIETTRVR